MHRTIGVIGTLAVFLLAPVLASAQPLADRIPQDALVYVGWKGSDTLGPAYEGSHLKAVLDSSNLAEFMNESVPRLIEKIAEEDRGAAKAFELVAAIGGPVWRHPTAIYIGPIDFAQPPMPHAALLCDAGNDAPALVAQFKQVVAMAGRPPFPLEVKQYNGLVVLLVGSVDPNFEKMLQAGGVRDREMPSLDQSAHFKEAMKQVNADPVFAAYVDVEAVLRLVDGTLAMAGDQKVQANWTHVRDTLGLGRLKRIVWTSGFDGKDWSDQAFVEAPAPRTGLLAMMDVAPISDDALRAIPKTATLAGAVRFSLGKTASFVLDGIKDFDPRTGAEMDDGLAHLNQMLGLDLQKDLLAALGDEWAVYSDPSIGGNGMTGFVVVNRLADPAKAEKSLNALEPTINDLIRQNMEPKMTIAMRQTKAGDLTLHYLNVPFVTPTWTIKDGNLYLALYPQMAQAAAEYIAGRGPSILENEAFAALVKRLGNQKATSINFQDLPKTAADGYGIWVLLSRYVAIGDVMGVQTPPMLIPPLNKLMPHLSPAGGVGWVDDAGWHMRDVSPFPLSTSLATNPLSAYSVAAPALLISILLPSLNKARESANQIKSAANLRQIGMGCVLYSNENNGKMPPDLGTLLLNEDLTTSVFVSPSSNTGLPPSLNKPEDRAAWINQHSDYVYLGAGKTMDMPNAADTVLAYEKLDIHRGIGANVLFGDGHVQFMRVPDVQRLLENQKAESKP